MVHFDSPGDDVGFPGRNTPNMRTVSHCAAARTCVPGVLSSLTGSTRL